MPPFLWCIPYWSSARTLDGFIHCFCRKIDTTETQSQTSNVSQHMRLICVVFVREPVPSTPHHHGSDVYARKHRRLLMKWRITESPCKRAANRRCLFIHGGDDGSRFWVMHFELQQISALFAHDNISLLKIADK